MSKEKKEVIKKNSKKDISLLNDEKKENTKSKNEKKKKEKIKVDNVDNVENKLLNTEENKTENGGEKPNTLDINSVINNENEEIKGVVGETNDTTDSVPEEEGKKKLSKKKKIIISCIVAAVVLGGVGATLGVVFGKKSAPVYDQTEDLVNDTTTIIKNNVDISNFKVEVGKDFNTNLSIKENKKEYYTFDYINVYSVNGSQTNNNDVSKKLLEINKDYTVSFSDENEKASLKVLANHFDNKLSLDIGLKIKKFDDLITFEGWEKLYLKNKNYEVKFTEKYPGILPKDTVITYTCGGYQPIITNLETHDCYKFNLVGDYNVSLSLSSKSIPGVTFGPQSVKCSIVIRDLSNEELSKIRYTKTELKRGCNEKVEYVNENVGDEYAYVGDVKPSVEYNIGKNNEERWVTTAPDDLGEYEIRTIFNFVSFHSYTLKGTCKVVPYAEIQCVFNVKENGGCWDNNKSDNESKTSSKKEIIKKDSGIEPTTLGDFIDITLQGKSPTKEGNEFIGWFNGNELIDPKTPIYNTTDLTVCAKFSPSKYTFNVKARDENAGVQWAVDPGYTVEYGANVTIKVTDYSKTSYKLASIDVNNTKYFFNENNEASFKMPVPPKEGLTVYIETIGTSQVEFDYDEKRVEVYDIPTSPVGLNPFKFKYRDKDIDHYKVKFVTFFYYKENAKTVEDLRIVTKTSEEFPEIIKPETDIEGQLQNGEIGCYVYVASIANTHTIHFNANDEKYKNKITLPNNIEQGYYNISVQEIINEFGSQKEAWHPYAAFKCWSYKSNEEKPVGENDLMPNNNLELYAWWYKYKFVFKDGDKVRVSGTQEYYNKYELTKDDISDLTVICESGYYFNGVYDVYVDGNKITSTTLDEPLAPGKFTDPIKTDGKEIVLRPVSNGNLHRVTFDPNGGTILNGEKLTSLKCGDKILDAINKNDISALYNPVDYAHCSRWQYYDGTQTLFLSESQPMPNADIVIKPAWDSYHFVVDTEGSENCVMYVTDIPAGDMKFEVYSDDFSVVPNQGCVFDHMEYWDSSQSKYIAIPSSSPIRPYQIFSDKIKQGDEVKVRIICKKTVDVFLYANGGTFEDGSDFKVYPIKYGSTWGEIKNLLPEPIKSGEKFSGWLNENGDVIDDSKIIDEHFTVFAKYGAQL